MSFPSIPAGTDPKDARFALEFEVDGATVPMPPGTTVEITNLNPLVGKVEQVNPNDPLALRASFEASETIDGQPDVMHGSALVKLPNGKPAGLITWDIPISSDPTLKIGKLVIEGVEETPDVPAPEEPA